jgi:hypothetical protein
MSKPSPEPEENTTRPTRTILDKRLLIGAVAGVILLAGLFGTISWQENSKFKAEVVRIENLIESDDFAAAESAITAAQLNNQDNLDLQALEDKASELKSSKSDFTRGSEYLLEKDYSLALSTLKKVLEIDTGRYDQAQAKIKQAESAYSLVVIAEAQRLKDKKSFNEALDTISRAGIAMALNADLVKLQQELKPLALAETKRAEQAQLAVYRAALNNMRVEKDKFDGTKFYTDRSTPYYANYSTFHIYIGMREGGDPYLRFKVRYSDEDWLFVESASINIDGDVRDIDVGSDWDRDNGSGDIWEWVDVNATDYHLDLVRDVIKSKSAVVRYYGSKYRDDRTITSTQKRALQNVLNAYEALKRQ